MPQRSIRFPDDLAAAIEDEAARRGRPHTFSSVLIWWATVGWVRSVAEQYDSGERAGTARGVIEVPAAAVPQEMRVAVERALEEATRIGTATAGEGDTVTVDLAPAKPAPGGHASGRAAPAKYVKNAAGRRIPVDEQGRIIG